MKERIAGPLRRHSVGMDTIAPDPANARVHPQANLDAIRGSLLAFGQQRPILVDGRGVIVAGSGLYLAARQLGWKRIAAIRSGLAGPDRTAYAIADNRTAELAEWDEEALARQLADLQAADVDLEALGFDADELKSLGMGIAEIGAPELPGGDREPFQEMTFTLSDAQAKTVKGAMAKAKKAGPFVDAGNENSNGNALARIAEAYLGQG